MGDELQKGEVTSAPRMQTSTEETRIQPVQVARGPIIGAAIGGGLATVGASLAAIPFPIPWLGPLLGAVLIGAGVIIAAVNGAKIDVPPIKR